MADHPSLVVDVEGPDLRKRRGQSLRRPVRRPIVSRGEDHFADQLDPSCFAFAVHLVLPMFHRSARLRRFDHKLLATVSIGYVPIARAASGLHDRPGCACWPEPRMISVLCIVRCPVWIPKQLMCPRGRLCPTHLALKPTAASIPGDGSDGRSFEIRAEPCSAAPVLAKKATESPIRTTRDDGSTFVFWPMSCLTSIMQISHNTSWT